MSNVSNLKREFKSFGVKDTTGKYTSGIAFDFEVSCSKAKVDVDEILADLLIVDATNKSPEYVVKKQSRINQALSRLDKSASFNPKASKDKKLDWVKKHLSMSEKIEVLADIQTVESIVEGTDPYPEDVAKARKAKSDAKQDCLKNAVKYKEQYAQFIAKVDKAIADAKARINNLEKQKLEILAPKAQNILQNTVQQDLTAEAKAELTTINGKISIAEKELVELEKLRADADLEKNSFFASLENSLRNYKIFDKDEKKEENKSDSKDVSGSSIKSPYDSLSDRGKQIADSQEAKELYQSFNAANSKNKFKMLTGPNARNMLIMAQNLSALKDRKSLQEYCEQIIDSPIISDSDIENFSITMNGQTLDFPSLTKSKLKDGLSNSDLNKLKGFYQALLCGIKLQDLSVEDLAKLQSYSKALLVSTTLSEAKWGKGGQILTGFFHKSRPKNSPNYDLGNDIASFLRPLCERRDKIFKDINAAVDKGIDSDDHVKYGYNSKVHHSSRKFENFDNER